MADDSIHETTMRELLDSGSVRAIAVVAQGDAWAVQVEVGTRWRSLRSAREPVRVWKSLDRLARWLKDDIGIVEWSTDARLYTPVQRSVVE